MQNVRIFNDTAGETHFAAVDVPMHPTDFAPPAPLVNLAAFTPASRFTFARLAAGWHGDSHPTPRRQVIFILSGIWDFTVSDGETRRFPPGSVLMLEDTAETHGRGHATQIVGDEDGLAAIVQLAD